MRAIQSIRASIDDGEPIHVILDNLNHHKNRVVRAWCDANNVELVFTPTYASWANPIEAHFGPPRQFVIANSDHADHPALARAIRSYLRWRNTHTRDPRILDAERRHRARIRSEQQRRWGHPRRAAKRANVCGHGTSGADRSVEESALDTSRRIAGEVWWPQRPKDCHIMPLDLPVERHRCAVGGHAFHASAQAARPDRIGTMAERYWRPTHSKSRSRTVAGRRRGHSDRPAG